MRRLLKILAWTVGGTLGVLALCLAALQTSAGQAALFSMVETFASTPDQRIKIDGPSGTFPTDLTLQKVEVADRTGTWVTIERARVAWSLRPLFEGRFVVDLLDADRIDLVRGPIPPEKREPKPSTYPPGGSVSLSAVRRGSMKRAVPSWRGYRSISDHDVNSPPN